MTLRIRTMPTDALDLMHLFENEAFRKECDALAPQEAERRDNALGTLGDFLCNCGEELEYLFDREEVVRDLLANGRIPEVPPQALLGLHTAPLGNAVACCYELAQRRANFRSPDVNLAGAFWLRHGAEICSMIATIDISSLVFEKQPDG